MTNEKTEIETLDLNSMSIDEARRIGVLQLFPEIRTEGGRIDFEKLKLALGEVIESGKERYGMTWPGKAECFKTIQTPSHGTLMPIKDESVCFDETKNLIIEGDNLEVLKLLQKSYLGQIKLIYIDPPYNTGNEFIYPDNYTESLQTYLEYSGQVDSEGRKYGTNSETDGRFHSRWLNMMYPRLYLARNLLRDDGLIILSIDDNEVDNLKRLLNEIFGEECFLGSVIVQANKRGQTYKEIAKTHEYLLIYSKEPGLELYELEKEDNSLPFKDSIGSFDLWELRNRNPKFGRFNRPNLYFPIYVSPKELDECGYSKISLIKDSKFTVEVFPLNSEGQEGCWRWGREKISGSDLSGKSPVLVAKQKRDGNWNIYEKSRKSTTKAKSLWADNEVISEQGTVQLGELGLSGVFDHPKPVGLIKRCLQIATKDDDLVLDFFAGAGTTAHSIIELNKEDGGNRKYILVQLPEPTSDSKYPKISDITKERVRRVIKKHNINDGFRVFRLSDSNFKTWDKELSKESLEKQLELHVDHVKNERTADDILFEILLKSGFPLTTEVVSQKFGKQTIFSISGGMLLVCLEDELTLDLIKHIAEQKPERVVCLDQGFANNDQLKANAVQIFRTKGIAKFQTV